MYTVYADDLCIYNDTYVLDSVKAVNPKLTLEDSSAGSFEITLPTTNVGYNYIQRMTTDIVVKKNGKEIWAGRVLSDGKDFWNNRSLFCEGELAFLNDTTQPPAEYHGITVRGFLETLINVHNGKVAANRRFTVGTVTVTDPNDSLYRYTNNETTIECINQKLVERLGGHLRVRKENGIRYIDYLEDMNNTNTQVIEFGKNLIDFTRNWDSAEYATVILPLGAHLEESEIQALDAYVTVEDVNGGSMYVPSAEAVAAFGWIEKVVHWDDVTSPSRLLTKAQKYLSDLQFDNLTLELTAIDMHYLNIDVEPIQILDKIRVKSVPHGMDRYFPITKMNIPLDQPENTAITMGDTVKTSLTAVNNQINSDILRKIENIPKAQTILEEAKTNATEIMNMATNGFVTIVEEGGHSEKLVISDSQDYTRASRMWVWNVNGLGYSKDGGRTFGLAMTMDGSIVADFITTGTLNAGIIRAGVLRDLYGNVEFDLEKGTLDINKGSISLGGNFYVTSTGYVLAKYGSIGGMNISDSAIYNDKVKLDANGLTMTDGSINLNNGTFSVNKNGYVTASSGYIGGMYISDSAIYNDDVRLSHDGLEVTKGSINLGNGAVTLSNTGLSMSKGNISLGYGAFSVDNSGTLTAKSGTIGGMTIASNSIYNNNVRIDSSGLTMTSGSINLGNGAVTLSSNGLTVTKGSIDLGNGSFSVDTNGNLTATKGTIGGFTIGTSSIYSEYVRLAKQGLYLIRDGYTIGKVGASKFSSTSSRGLSFNLNSNGSYMAWSYKTSDDTTDDPYHMILAYTSTTLDTLTSNRLHVMTALDMRNHKIFNAKFDSSCTLPSVTISTLKNATLDACTIKGNCSIAVVSGATITGCNLTGCTIGSTNTLNLGGYSGTISMVRILEMEKNSSGNWTGKAQRWNANFNITVSGGLITRVSTS